MRYNFRALQQNFDQINHYLYLDSNPGSTDSGVYLQGEIALRENLLMSAGIRYDHYSSFGGSANPRFALVYSPWEKTTAKLVYGHAYRAPSVYEMFYADGYSNKQNTGLHPENIHTLELVLEQYLTRKIRLSGSGYLYRIRQQITQQVDSEDELIVFENFGSVRGKGLEVQLEGKDISGFDASLSYMHQSTEDRTTGSSLPNSPRHMAQLKLYFPTFKTRGGAGLEMQYMSSRQTLRNDRVGGFLRTNLTLSYNKIFPGLDVSAGLYNLFNRQYSDPGGGEHVQDSIAQDGRSFRVRLGYRFHGR
jgi:iron complex outermembrane receptor protein